MKTFLFLLLAFSIASCSRAIPIANPPQESAIKVPTFQFQNPLVEITGSIQMLWSGYLMTVEERKWLSHDDDLTSTWIDGLHCTIWRESNETPYADVHPRTGRPVCNPNDFLIIDLDTPPQEVFISAKTPTILITTNVAQAKIYNETYTWSEADRNERTTFADFYERTKESNNANRQPEDRETYFLKYPFRLIMSGSTVSEIDQVYVP